MKAASDRAREQVIVSAASPDGTLVDTVLSEAGETALVVSRQNQITCAESWQHEGVTHRPIRASNNLLRHSAVKLPSEPLAYESVAELLAEIDAYIGRYVALGTETRHLATAYVLLTWLYDRFGELPYLRFRGEYGTGKSRALLVVGGITYKPFFASGASTVSPIFHTLDTFRGTLIFDEADFRFTDEKAELVKILNNGNAKGFPVLRTRVTEKREFDPQAFVVFGPKIIGMRHTYEDRALESRFLSIYMQPGSAVGVPINLPTAQEAEALALRNKLLQFRFDYFHQTALDPSLADPMLEPRTNQIVLPLLSVACDEVMRKSIRTFVRERERGIRSERSLAPEAQILSLLQGSKANRLTFGDIAARFSVAHRDEYGRPVTPRYVGTLLRRLGVSVYKTNGVYAVAPGQEDRLSALAMRHGIADQPTSRDLGTSGTSHGV